MTNYVLIKFKDGTHEFVEIDNAQSEIYELGLELARIPQTTWTFFAANGAAIIYFLEHVKSITQLGESEFEELLT